MTEDYKEKLQSALQYQDFVAVQLYKAGTPLMQLGSKRYQQKIGESINGFQVKYDRMFRKTGNVYIEYEEKSNPLNAMYVQSGILRKDNTWMWCIGDYEDIFIVPKKSLIKMYDRCRKNGEYRKHYGISFKETPTSRGMTVPLSVMNEHLCCKHIHVPREAGVVVP